jgi:hypothetical protein
MELKNIFDNRFPRNLRIRYRGIISNMFINEKISYLINVNKIDSYNIGNKYIERIKKQARYLK